MQQAMVGLRLVLWMTLLTGVIYPLLVTGISQLLLPYTAGGSLIRRDDQVLGSTLIGQNFSQPKYFWSRPSTIGYNPLPSGGSNLGPTSVVLQKQVAERRALLLQANPQADPETLPVDLLYCSGSGLDPHISPAAAQWQLERVAAARNFSSSERQQLAALVEQSVEYMQFGILGKPRVNTLKLNLAIDAMHTDSQ